MSQPVKQPSPHSRSSSDQSSSGWPGSSRSGSLAAPGFHVTQPGTKFFSIRFRQQKEAERRQAQCLQPPHLQGAARVQRDAHAFRRSTAALTRETLVPKAQRQATLPETRPERSVLKAAPTWGRRPRASPRALPAPSCHRPASTSRTGHSAGRVMPKPPGSKGDEPKPAGTAISLPPAAVTRPASFTQSEAAWLLPGARWVSSVVS
jgi:hypothetical protein